MHDAGRKVGEDYKMIKIHDKMIKIHALDFLCCGSLWASTIIDERFLIDKISMSIEAILM